MKCDDDEAEEMQKAHTKKKHQTSNHDCTKPPQGSVLHTHTHTCLMSTYISNAVEP